MEEEKKKKSWSIGNSLKVKEKRKVEECRIR